MMTALRALISSLHHSELAFSAHEENEFNCNLAMGFHRLDLVPPPS